MKSCENLWLLVYTQNVHIKYRSGSTGSRYCRCEGRERILTHNITLITRRRFAGETLHPYSSAYTKSTQLLKVVLKGN